MCTSFGAGEIARCMPKGLVTGGMFAHSRNPLYLGNLLVAPGTPPDPWQPMGVGPRRALLPPRVRAIVAAEEAFLLGKFGGSYEAYRRDVPRWIPRLRGIRTSLEEIAVQLASSGAQGVHQHLHVDGRRDPAARDGNARLPFLLRASRLPGGPLGSAWGCSRSAGRQPATSRRAGGCGRGGQSDGASPERSEGG